MSDDSNRPDPDHELEVDLGAFLPEGSRFATDDDEPVEDGEHEAARPVAETEAGSPLSETARPVAATTTSESTEPDDGWGIDAPAPEMPAWARDDLPPAPVHDAVPSPAPASASADAPSSSVAVDVARGAEADGGEPEASAEPDAGPAVAAAPEVDTTVLTRIEGELAAVDEAIAVIDAGDLTRSPLLTELLATDQSRSASPPADDPGT